MKTYTIGIDIGTSGTKTVLFDETGSVCAAHTMEYPLSQPYNGWAEQNPSDWADAAFGTIKAVIEKSGVSPADIAGVGLSGQMHGLVMLDADNRVLRPSIIWCDQRTGAECEEITARVGRERLISITANPALTGFTASKILWVRNHEPGVYAKCAHILLPKDYIRFLLTGVYASDVSDAGGMQLLDVPKRTWSDEILGALDINRKLLGTLYESPEITGTITEEAARLTGLLPGTPVVGGAGDNAAAAVGVGVVAEGDAFTTIGTSGVVFAHTDSVCIDPMGRIHTFCCAVPGAWHVMGVTQAAGLSLRWLRDTVCTEEQAMARARGCDPYEIMCAEAAESKIGANRLIYLPYLMGERTPHLDPDVRGAFIGLSAMHNRSDLIRAVLEGVTYSLCDCMAILKEMQISPRVMRLCGGGARSPFWRQMLSDLFGIPTALTTSTEGPALGAAILAMVGAGIYQSVPEASRAIIRLQNELQPDRTAHDAYQPYYALYRSLYGNLRESYHKLAELK